MSIGPLHEAAERVVLDLARVTGSTPAALRCSPTSRRALADGGRGPAGLGRRGRSRGHGPRRASTCSSMPPAWPRPPRFAELDAAIEWCEERLLSRGTGPRSGRPVELVEHPVLAGLTAEGFAAAGGRRSRSRTWAAGETIVRRGEPAGELYLVTRGELSVYVPMEGRDPRPRLATLTAGMVLGEVSFLSEGTGPRTSWLTPKSRPWCSMPSSSGPSGAANRMSPRPCSRTSTASWPRSRLDSPARWPRSRHDQWRG